MSKTEERLTNLETVNEVAEKKALDDRTISTKEIYERLIILETKFDSMDKDNKRVENKFTFAVIIVAILEIANLLVHVFFMGRMP